MIKVSLMGHIHIQQDELPVRLSAKSIALLTYLVLERREYHRDHLADLLWEHADARQNLRVELAKLRSSGISGFPPGRKLLSVENGQTDWLDWQSENPLNLSDSGLQRWLSMLRGLPLSGLDDVGGEEFGIWVQGQRQLVLDSVLNVLQKSFRDLSLSGRHGAAKLINARLEFLGLEPFDQIESDNDGLYFQRPEIAELQQAVAASRKHSVHLCLVGPMGSGKSFELTRILEKEHFTVVNCDLQSLRMSLAVILQAVSSEVNPDKRVMLENAVLGNDIEVAAVAVAMCLNEIKQPVALVFEQNEFVSPDIYRFMQLIVNGSSGVLVSSVVSNKHKASGYMQAIQRITPPNKYFMINLDSVRLEGVAAVLRRVRRDLTEDEIHRISSLLLQESAGLPIKLHTLISQQIHQVPGQDISRRIDAEIDSWPAEMRIGLESLSLVLAPIDLNIIAALKIIEKDKVPAFLRIAHDLEALREHQIVDRVLVRPDRLAPVINHSATQSNFRDEMLRIRLASRIPSSDRRHANLHLARYFAQTDPSLASLYAVRAGEVNLASQLREAARKKQVLFTTQLSQNRPSVPQKIPVQTARSNMMSTIAEGYSLTLEGGWLYVRRKGIYGHAKDLKLEFMLPQVAHLGGELKIVWRIDLFNGAFELMPTQIPYPMAVKDFDGETYVFLTSAQINYQENGMPHTVVNDVSIGVWMEHRLKLSNPQESADRILFMFRALDVAITIAEIEWKGRSLIKS